MKKMSFFRSHYCSFLVLILKLKFQDQVLQPKSSLKAFMKKMRKP